MAIGWPVVRPSKTPERNSTVSASLRGVVMSLCPGRRRSRSACTSATVSGSPGGQPSTTTPTDGPWLSPQVEIEKSLPKELGMSGEGLDQGAGQASLSLGPEMSGRAMRSHSILAVSVNVLLRVKLCRACSAFALLGGAWCPRPELNRDHTFRKRVLYPFELRGLTGFPERPGRGLWQSKNAR